MAAYETPNVYIEEKSTSPSIQMAGASTALVIGVAPEVNAHVNEPYQVYNWSQFVKAFVNGRRESTDLVRGVKGFFENGGRRCYILNLGRGGSIAGDGSPRSGISAAEGVDDIQLVVAPGFTDAISHKALIAHCEKMKERFAILDVQHPVDNLDLLTKVGSAEAPAKAGGSSRSAEKEKDEDEKPEPARKKSTRDEGCRPPMVKSGCAAAYYPWFWALDPLKPQDEDRKPNLVETPPSGHLAGIYACTDVHRAPANVSIAGAQRLAYRLTDAEQGPLNSAGVNCIRYFSDVGITVWGARTLAETSSEWKYVPVRRTMLMIEESIKKDTRLFVFEPNDERTWMAVERIVTNFLKFIWKLGMLQGESMEKAFFVKCDAETNPPEMVDAGRLVTEIGVALLKPAEFVVFQLSQWDGGATTTESE